MIKLRWLFVFMLMTILFNNKAMAQWTPQPSGLPTGISVFSFHPVDPNTIWAIGLSYSRPSQGFLKSVDGGKTWRVRTIPNASGLWFGSIFARDSSTAWISTVDFNCTLIANILKTSDGGNTWVKQTTAFPASGGCPNWVYFFDANNGVSMGDPTNGYFEIYTTTNSGDNWTRVSKDQTSTQLTLTSIKLIKAL